TTVREYDLSYTSGNNATRSLLSSVQETGWDANGNNPVTLPATSFSYVNSGLPFVVTGPTYVGSGQASIIADVNGNSKNDITLFYKQTVGGALVGNVALDQTVQVSPTPPDYWANQTNGGCNSAYPPAEIGTRLVDVNADGKADVVRGLWNYTTSTTTWE